MSNWLTYSPSSGRGDGTVCLTASTIEGGLERSDKVIFYNSKYGITATTEVLQLGKHITAITFDNVIWNTDLPSSGGTADSGNCSFSIIGYFDDGTTGNVTSETTVVGSVNVEPSYVYGRHSAGTLTLNATYINPIGQVLTATTDVVIYQELQPYEVSGISLNNLTWVTDIPVSGGTATSANCDYIIFAQLIYSGVQIDVTDVATVTGSTSIPSSRISNKHRVGTITLTASYLGYTDSGSISVWQGFDYINEYLTFRILTGGTIVFNADRQNSAVTLYYSINNSEWNSYGEDAYGTDINVSSGDIVRFKGNYHYNYGYSWEESTAYFDVYGNILSFCYGDSFKPTDRDQQNPSPMFSLFFANSNVVDAGGLVLTTAIAPGIGQGATFKYMFWGCESLTTAPMLKARSYSNDCCYGMFIGCSNLDYIWCMANNRTEFYSMINWVQDVSHTGTFVKNPELTQNIPIGNNGIPSGWTVVDAMYPIATDGFSIENVKLKKDIPASGGVVTAEDCYCEVTVTYTDNTKENVNGQTVFFGSATIDASTDPNRHGCGVLVLEGYYGPYESQRATTAHRRYSVSLYQEGYSG